MWATLPLGCSSSHALRPFATRPTTLMGSGSLLNLADSLINLLALSADVPTTSKKRGGSAAQLLTL